MNNSINQKLQPLPLNPVTPSSQVLHLKNISLLSLTNVNLKVDEGEHVAIIGESGAGKSVLLNVILGLLQPNQGEAMLFGRTIGRGTISYQGLGVAFQQPGLFDALTITENINLGLSNVLSPENILALLKSFNLDTLSPYSPIGNLSGGQQKRVALARALVHATKLLVLDEPTSGLDSRSIIIVIEALKERLNNCSIGLLIITHDYKLAYELCDRILLLTNGMLQDVTPNKELNENQAVESLQEALEASSRAVPIVGKSAKISGWSTGRNLRQFLPGSLFVAVPMMALLSIMLVVQSKGISPIDVSRFIPGMVTLALFRELIPLVTGLLLVSRVGGTISAEISGMSYSAQLDSMKVMQLSPYQFLVRPIILAAIVTFPIVYIMCGGLSVLSAACIAELPWSGLHIGMNRFIFLAMHSLTIPVVCSCLLKGIISGFGVALVSYFVTARPIRNASSLGIIVTRAGVSSSIIIVLVDIIISWIFF